MGGRAADECREAYLRELLRDLSAPGGLPEPLAEPAPRQTHLSAVFLGRRFAYKLKKPVRFDFVDFSTLELRKQFLEAELHLNRRLAPELYLDLVPVIREHGSYRAAPAGVEADRVCDWLLRMVRMDEARMLDRLVAVGEADTAAMTGLAERVARFHASSPSVDDVGSPEQVLRVADESLTGFDRRAEIIPEELYTGLADFLRSRGLELRPVLERRWRDGWIREVHGDLRLQNICFDENIGDGFQIFDCVEFTRRFRCTDVLSDLAYLLMDLNLAGRRDLAMAVCESYQAVLPKAMDERLLQYYEVFRAAVRGKIAAMAAEDPAIPDEGRQAHATTAAAAFDLARGRAAWREPQLMALCGYSGSGKSTIARELARRLPAVHLSTDLIRKEMAGLSPSQRLGPEAYAEARVEAVYAELHRRSSALLAGGKGVILDASYLDPGQREAARSAASQAGARCRFIICTAPEEVIRARLELRTASGEDASDAGLEVYRGQMQRYPTLPVNEGWVVEASGRADAVARGIIDRLVSEGAAAG